MHSNMVAKLEMPQRILPYDFASGSEITQWNKIDKPLVVYYGSPGGTFLLITYHLFLTTYHLLLITNYLSLITSTYYLLLNISYINPYNAGNSIVHSL